MDVASPVVNLADCEGEFVDVQINLTVFILRLALVY